MFKNPFSFKGRIGRGEFAISFLVYFVWNVVGSALMEEPNPSVGACLFVLIPLIPMVWFFWAQGVKRCHDLGHSGWFLLIPFYVFVMLFGKGDINDNEYGNSLMEL